MLENVDLKKKLNKREVKSIIEDLQNDIMVLQQEMRSLKIPMIILFDGWDASGKGKHITKLIEQMDTRAFKVYSSQFPESNVNDAPALANYWNKIPEYGKVSIFNESWNQQIVWEAYEGIISENEKVQRYNEIVDFERLLLSDRYVIVKIFLHLSQKEQKKRQKAQLEDPLLSRYVRKVDLYQNRDYEEFESLFNDMLQRTNRLYCPWHVISAEDDEVCQVDFLTKIRDSMQFALDFSKKMKSGGESFNYIEDTIDDVFHHVPMPMIQDIDLNVSFNSSEYKKLKKKLSRRLNILENKLNFNKIPLIILYEGWDAGGKGGNIRRLTQAWDPRSYTVNTTASPTPLEKNYHYLWRFWRNIPPKGKIAIFDRTWYGRVMVERVEGFASEMQWKRAFREINEFEKVLTNWGAIIVKFWIQIDQDEQLRRFNERQNNPDKQWKITDEDWRNREKWPLYEEAINEMIQKTSTESAPWTIIEGNDKKYARIKAMKTVIEAIEKRIK